MAKQGWMTVVAAQPAKRKNGGPSSVIKGDLSHGKH
jgi:hypothetical protein